MFIYQAIELKAGQKTIQMFMFMCLCVQVCGYKEYLRGSIPLDCPLVPFHTFFQKQMIYVNGNHYKHKLCIYL